MSAVPTRAPRPDESLSEIVARLASAQKSNRGAPGYSRWINRPLGRRLAAMAYRSGLTPNQITVCSAVVTFAAVAVLATVRPTVPAGVVIALMLALGFALDAADGQLARLRGGGSPAGEWLDHVVDCIKTATIHLAVLVCWARHFDLSSQSLLAIPLVFAVEASVFFFAIILTEQLRRSHAGLQSNSRPQSDEPAPFLRSILVLPADYGVLCVAMALLGFHTAFVWVYAALMVANVLFLAGALPKWYREMNHLGDPAGG